MIREITIGQFYPSGSFLHRLDARVKIIGVLLFVICLFAFNDLPGYIFASLFLASMIAVSKVPVAFIFRGIKPLIFLLMITVIFNLFLVPGRYILEWWIFKISIEGIQTAAAMALRLVYLIFGTSLLTFTTTPNNMTDAMESQFRPLKLFKAPVHEIAMMMSIALRFIPILLEETDKIMKAQTARGADFESGNIVQKVKSLVPVLVPLFISAFRRANDLALAMEARCYTGGEGRTKMKPLKYERRDYAAFLFFAVYLVLLIVTDILIRKVRG